MPEGISTALDIGCGTGKLGAQLGDLGILTDGVTNSKPEKKIAKKILREVWLFNLEEGLPRIDKSYDVVLMSHVMEHIANPHQLMRDLGNVLKESGQILCAIPNMLFLYNRLKLMMGRVEYEEFGLMDYTHLRWYTRKTLVELFQSYGYRVDAALVHGYVPLGPIRKLLTGKAAQSLDKTIVKLAPDLLACEFAFRFTPS